MAYNFYSGIENIYRLKGDWDQANKAGDEQGKFNASTQAQVYYDELRKNGYGDIADELQKSNYEQAKGVLDKWSSKKPTNYVYTADSDVGNIYKSKGLYDEAIAKGDQAGADTIAAKAQAYYNNLKQNGYSDIANELSASNYEQAKGIHDKVQKTGKTATRDYLYTLGQSKGMSKEEVDALIGWDNQTGEVSFGGKKIGTPDTVVDGVSYWSDTSVLDNAFNDYISRSGHINKTGIDDKINQLWGIQADDRKAMSGKYDKLEETAYSNPFESAEAKAILGKYDLAGLQARDNATASGGGSNGGNIDSYAAANAQRQQASLLNMGQMAVLDAHNNKINNVKGILESLGVYQQNQDLGMQNTIGLQQSEEQRLFENEQTAKLNDTAMKVEIANITGIVPDEWVAGNNPFMNDDGTIKEKFDGVDFSNVMKEAKEAGNQKLYEYAAMARYYKIMGNYGLYGQYDDGQYIAPEPTATEAKRQFDETMQYNRDVFDYEKSKDSLGYTSLGGRAYVTSSSPSSSPSNSPSSSDDEKVVPDRSGYRVVGGNDDSKTIRVDGTRLSVTEVQKGLNDGTIKAVYDDNAKTVTYKRN